MTSQSVHAKELDSIKKFLWKVISNVEQSTYQGVRIVRKKFLRLPRATFTAKDREKAEVIKKILLKLHKTHPELSSKENYIQFRSFKNTSQSKETTFDRPKNSIDNSNASKSFFRSSFLRSPVQKHETAQNQKKTANKKKKIKQGKKIAGQKAYETPVAPLNNETLTTADDKDVTNKKISQYIKWAYELRMELRKRQEMSKVSLALH